MLAAFPLRDEDSFRNLVLSRFPLARFDLLDTGVRARTLAFSSNPAALFARGPRGGLAPRVCILDWGIGGLGVYRIFKARHPATPVLYFSDSGYTPYGKVPARELVRRLAAIKELLEMNGIRFLMVACNAMSTILDRFDPGPRMKVCGVIRPAVEHLTRAGYKAVGVIGGRRTIGSRAYRTGLEEAGIKVTDRVTQPLSAFIERGDTSSPAFNTFLDGAMAPFENVPALVLACTHYPAASRQIRARTSAVLVDPAVTAVDWVDAHWKVEGAWATSRSGPSPASAREAWAAQRRGTGSASARAARVMSASPHDIFITTGDPVLTEAAAKSMFGVSIPRVLGMVY